MKQYQTFDVQFWRYLKKSTEGIFDSKFLITLNAEVCKTQKCIYYSVKLSSNLLTQFNSVDLIEL